MLEQDKKIISSSCYEEMGATLKIVCQLSSADCYVTNFIADLYELAVLKVIIIISLV